MNVIVGSGPSGIAAALALIEQGKPVLLLDGGEILESDVSTRVKSLAQDSKTSHDQFSFIKSGFSPDSSGIAEKFSYGSNYPFRSAPEQFVLSSRNMGNVRPTLAVGGFSTVWGAACTAFHKDDIADWPVTRDELEFSYNKISAALGITGETDDLSEQFQMTHFSQPPVELGEGLKKLHQRLIVKKSRLKDLGFFFGKSRIALDTSTCRNCGLCMYGCPWQCIYSTEFTLEKLKQNSLFQYRPNVIVKKFTEEAQQVRVDFFDRKKKTNDSLVASRLFVGCGTFESTALVLNSMGAYGKEVKFKVSEYFLLPFLSFRPGSMNANQVTLAQLFFEIKNKKISDHLVHLQLYDYNELFREAIVKTLGSLYFLFKPFEKLFLARFFIGQGYLHSDESSTITGNLNNDGVLNLTGVTNPRASRTFSVLKRYLLKVGLISGFLPLLPLFKRGLPGDGRHLGCSFPMSLKPQGLQSDILGRVGSFQRVHIIDSSIFPSVPATTITFTIMANAYRIAYSVGKGGA